MDDKTPDISGFSASPPVIPVGGQSANPYAGGVSSGAYQPPIGGQMGTMLEDEGVAKKKKQRRILYAVFIVLFGLACALSIGAYVYVNSESASASTDTDLSLQNGSSRVSQNGALGGINGSGDQLAGGNPGQSGGADGTNGTGGTPGNPSPSGVMRRISPTIEIQLAPSDTPIPSPTTRPRPTFPNNPATQTPIPRPTKEPWKITWAENPINLTIAFVPLTGCFPGTCGIPLNATATPTPSVPKYQPTNVTATLRGPLLSNDIVCIKPSDTFMAKKRNSTAIERLCDYFDPVNSEPYQCYRYNTASGIPIQSKIAPGAEPYSKCTSNSGADTGTYVLHTIVHYECSDTKQSSCNQEIELFSEDLTVQ